MGFGVEFDVLLLEGILIFLWCKVIIGDKIGLCKVGFVGGLKVVWIGFLDNVWVCFGW